MACCDVSERPLLARIRGLFGKRTRALCAGAFLILGALSCMPIRPEEIEEHMRSMGKAKVVQLLENEQASGDPPEREDEIRVRVAADPYPFDD